MIILQGIGVSPGVSIAPAFVMDNASQDIPERHLPADRAQEESKRFDEAVETSRDELLELQERTVGKIGKEASRIFDFHLDMLADAELQRRIRHLIEDEHTTAQFATASVMQGYAAEFRDMPEFFADRVKDLYDIERRLLRQLTGERQLTLSHLTRDVSVLAHDLTPSQTAALDRKHIRGMATEAGGATSHTAIVARALGIPAVVGLEGITAAIITGEKVIIDGSKGRLIVSPDKKTLETYQARAWQQIEFLHSLDALRELPATTIDDHEVALLGNIEFPDEVDIVHEKGGTGVGLYRTEFLFLGSDTEPTEENHYQAYRQVIEQCGDQPIVIRTLDLGADKYTQAQQRQKEPNPMLGCRSIRFCLQHVDVFRTQIRAILRAAVSGDVRMLLPLICNISELRQAKSLIRDVSEDLEDEGIDHNPDIPIGIMVEVPAAALQAEAFAKEVDFFSIGTNDLVQYTLAVDRTNERVAHLFTAGHPAVLHLIREVVRTGQQYEVPVSLCGEIAGDPEYTLLLLGLGLRHFSCTPSAIPEIKKIIRSVTIQQSLEVARQVSQMDTERDIANYLRMTARKILPEVYDD